MRYCRISSIQSLARPIGRVRGWDPWNVKQTSSCGGSRDGSHAKKEIVALSFDPAFDCAAWWEFVVERKGLKIALNLNFDSLCAFVDGPQDCVL